MPELLLALPTKKARRWTAKTITFLAAFYLTEEEKESMPSGVFSAPIVASEIYMPAVGDTWVYQGEFLVAVHRHSGAFKKYSRGVRVPPIVVYAKQPVDTVSAEFQAFLMKVVDESGRMG
jgi:hypothetical protein